MQRNNIIISGDVNLPIKYPEILRDAVEFAQMIMNDLLCDPLVATGVVGYQRKMQKISVSALRLQSLVADQNSRNPKQGRWDPIENSG